MVKPSIDQLTNNEFNRYILVIAAAKSARYITNKQNEQKRIDDDRTISELEKQAMVREEFPDEKPVKTAINKLYCGDFKISDESLMRAKTAGQNSIEN